MRIRPHWPAAVVALVLLVGCAGQIMPGAASTTNVTTVTPASNSTSAASGLAGRTFLSTAVTGHALADGTRISVSFADGQLSANAGCNTMSGPVTLDGGHLQVSDLATTEIGCPSALAEQDSWLAQFLSAGPTWRLIGDHLTLGSGEVTVKLTDKKVAEPDLPIVGTTWELTGLIDGDAASSMPSGSTPVHLELDEKTLRLWNDCVAISGRYTLTDGTLAASLAVPPVTSSCDIAPIATAVPVLRQGAAATVDADQLQLLAPDGSGLMFSAVGAGTNPPQGSGDAPTSSAPASVGTGEPAVSSPTPAVDGGGQSPTTAAPQTGGSAPANTPAPMPATNPLAGRTFVLTGLFTDAGGVDTRKPDARFRITFGAHDAVAESQCGTHHYSTVAIGKREALGLAVDLGTPDHEGCSLGADPSGIPGGLLYFGKRAGGGYYLSTGFVAWYFDEVTR